METTFRPHSGPSLAKQILTSPWLWGGAVTWGFYQSIPYLPVGQAFSKRYFCGHELEYIETGLFFVGLAILTLKSIALTTERRAFQLMPQFGPDEPVPELATATASLEKSLHRTLTGLRDTYWARRIERLIAYLRAGKNSQELNSHLAYLTEAEGDQLHSSHALLQTVIWAIPILGFLGTVMGITLAIANVTPEQLETSLNDVTGGLAVAFDTTAIALAYSLVLVFGTHFVKRSEEHLLSEIDEHCRVEARRCFPDAGTSAHPLLAAEEQAAELLIRQTTALVDRQTSIWNSAILTLREQWVQTLDQQRACLEDSLLQGTRQTLAQHAEALADARTQLLSNHEELSQRLMNELDQRFDRRQQSDAAMIGSLQQSLASMKEFAEHLQQHQMAETSRFLSGFGEQMDRLEEHLENRHSQFGQLADALVRQSESMLEHGAQLERIGTQEESLLRLQDHLNRNLESLRTTEVFDETLHNLNAAVHLLTARVRGREAA
jgi:biopolymer transport protein ExbB/TolQ